MSERPTPETDTLDRELHNPKVLSDRYSIMRDHSNNLERQRNNLQDQRDFAIGEIQRLRKERDEARKDVRKLQDIKQKHEHEELVAAQENDRLKIERDEAREALRFIAEWGGRTLESEYGDIECNGKWCAEQAKEAAE